MPQRPLFKRTAFSLGLLLISGLVVIASPANAGGNIRGGVAQVDPGLGADITVDDIFFDADLDSGSGLAVGLEMEGRRLGFGLEVTRSDHDIGAAASVAGQTLDFGTITTAEIYTVLLAIRYRVNPESSTVLSVAALGGGIGYIDFELPDGDTTDGGAPAYGLELALDWDFGQPSGLFARVGYRQMEADVDFEDIAPELADTPFEPSIGFAQIGYRFGGRR